MGGGRKALPTVALSPGVRTHFFPRGRLSRGGGLRLQEPCHKFRAMRWIFGSRDRGVSTDTGVVKALEHRLDGVEDDVAHLSQRFGRLNARITAALRYVPEEYEDEREDDQ